MDLRSSGSTFSSRLTVFSGKGVTDRAYALTCLDVVLDSEELGLVISGDGWVSVGIAWKERQLFGHVIGLHVFYSTVLSFE